MAIYKSISKQVTSSSTLLLLLLLLLLLYDALTLSWLWLQLSQTHLGTCKWCHQRGTQLSCAGRQALMAAINRTLSLLSPISRHVTRSSAQLVFSPLIMSQVSLYFSSSTLMTERYCICLCQRGNNVHLW